MKVLFIGVYRDGTGWSHSAIEYIKALDSVGVDVVCRPLRLNNSKNEIPKLIQELEQKSSLGCDYVIEYLLPHHMEYDGRFKKCVGLYTSETSNFKNASWADKLNMMDEVWCLNKQMEQAALESGVTKPIKVISHPIDSSKMNASYKPLDSLLKSHSDSFKFYFIGEAIRRKNLHALLRAYHLEFDIDEPVSLVIKTNLSGVSSTALTARLKKFSDELKEGLKLYRGADDYKKEVWLTQRLSEMDILRLHSTCNCFVMPSYGEAWSIPAAEAMAMGNTPIVTDLTGMVDYVSNDEGWVIPAQWEPVHGMMESVGDIYVANENWASIDIPELRKAMRQAYSNKVLRHEKAMAGIDKSLEFSYEKIGTNMKEALES